MRKIKCILKRCEENGTLSENDTQALLVEPVLCLAGYNIYNPSIIKRASRASSRQEFDVEVYKNGKLFIAIEVKSLSSKEFNISKINNGIGALSQQQGQWTNEPGDGVGQLRAYCVNWSSKINNGTIPVITNGKEWVLFNLSAFVNNLNQNISSSMILGQAEITDDNFFETIIKKIKNT